MDIPQKNHIELKPGFKSTELYSKLIAIFTMYGAPTIAFKLNAMFPELNLTTVQVLGIAGTIMGGVTFLVTRYVNSRHDHKKGINVMNYELKMAKYKMLTERIKLENQRLVSIPKVPRPVTVGEV